MKFYKHVLYKHAECRDVCIEVLKVFPIPAKPGVWSLRVRWWRHSDKRGLLYCIGIEQRIRTTTEGWRKL